MTGKECVSWMVALTFCRWGSLLRNRVYHSPGTSPHLSQHPQPTSANTCSVKSGWLLLALNCIKFAVSCSMHKGLQILHARVSMHASRLQPAACLHKPAGTLVPHSRPRHHATWLLPPILSMCTPHNPRVQQAVGSPAVAVILTRSRPAVWVADMAGKQGFGTVLVKPPDTLHTCPQQICTACRNSKQILAMAASYAWHAWATTIVKM
jgi:hypothetical protein